MGKLLIGLAVLGFSQAVFAGVVFQVETTYHASGGSPESSELSVEGKNLKMEISSSRGRRNGGGSAEATAIAGESASDSASDSVLGGLFSREAKPDSEFVIYNDSRREIYFVDPENKEYMSLGEISRGTQEIREKKGRGALGGLGGLLGGLTGEQKRAVEGFADKLLEGAAEIAKQQAEANRPEIRRIGDRRTVNGYPCIRYDVYRQGEKVQELWVTDWDNIRGGRQVAGAFENMNALLDEVAQSNDFPSMFEAFTKVDGFPVVTREFEGGELEGETVLESVSERDLDPDAFEPPKGYRLRTMGPQ